MAASLFDVGHRCLRVKLTDLEPRFLRHESDTSWREVQTIAEADGISFVCPQCFKANGMKRPGVHSVICWQPRVPASTSPGPGRWTFSGTGYRDLTLSAKSSSIHLTGPGCGAHFFIRNGEIKWA